MTDTNTKRREFVYAYVNNATQGREVSQRKRAKIFRKAWRAAKREIKD